MPQADLAVGRIASLAGLLVLVIICAVGIAILLTDVLPVPADTVGSRPLAFLAEGAAPLLSAPQPARQLVRERKLQRLHANGQVDPARGIVHIPIDAAMDRLSVTSEPATDAADIER